MDGLETLVGRFRFGKELLPWTLNFEYKGSVIVFKYFIWKQIALLNIKIASLLPQLLYSSHKKPQDKSSHFLSQNVYYKIQANKAYKRLATNLPEKSSSILFCDPFFSFLQTAISKQTFVILSKLCIAYEEKFLEIYFHLIKIKGKSRKHPQWWKKYVN